MSNNVHIMLDLDGVLATTAQYYTNKKKWHPKYKCYRFDKKCVKVFNEILDEIGDYTIILSSDWKTHFTLDEMNEIFEWNGVNTKIHEFTSSSWGVQFQHFDQIEESRAYEILKYVKDNNIKNYIVIDDLNLKEWISVEYFVRTTKPNEGIKQSGIKEKILKLIKNYE